MLHAVSQKDPKRPSFFHVVRLPMLSIPQTAVEGDSRRSREPREAREARSVGRARVNLSGSARIQRWQVETKRCSAEAPEGFLTVT